MNLDLEKKEVKSFDPNGITDYLNTTTETEIKYQNERKNNVKNRKS